VKLVMISKMAQKAARARFVDIGKLMGRHLETYEGSSETKPAGAWGYNPPLPPSKA
jgi:hypothetical protein